MSSIEDLRSRLATVYTSRKTDFGVETVTFQPSHTKPNEDRMVCEKWDIFGQQWLFLAVCDGMLLISWLSVQYPSLCVLFRSRRAGDRRLRCGEAAKRHPAGA